MLVHSPGAHIATVPGTLSGPQVARAQRPLPWDADATRETHVVYSGTKPKTVIVTTVGPGP